MDKQMKIELTWLASVMTGLVVLSIYMLLELSTLSTSLNLILK